MRPHSALAADYLYLRKQSAMYLERNLKPRRPDTAFRIGLVVQTIRLEARTRCYPTPKLGPLAPLPRLSPVLALEITSGSTTDTH